MSEDEKYSLLQETLKRYEGITVRQRVMIRLEWVLIISLIVTFVSLYLEIKREMKNSDRRRAAWISQMVNMNELNRQQIDSMRRYHDSIKYFRCR